MRLFTALELNTKVIANLTELVRRLRPVAPIRWVHPQNMHVSLKYIGEWPESRLDTLVRSLSEVRVTQPMTVPLAGLGYFPSAQRPRVFWGGSGEHAAPAPTRQRSRLPALAAWDRTGGPALHPAPHARPDHL